MKKLLSMWIITLVLSIPIYSSLVLADITVISVTGEENIDGYMSDESNQFKIVANSTFDTIFLMDHLNNWDVPFSCVPSGGIFECSYQDDGYFDAGVYEFRLAYVFDQEVKETSSKEKLVVDGEPPQIEKFEILQDAQSIIAEYRVRDRSDNETFECIGFGKLSFMIDGKVQKTENFDLNPGNCVIDGNIDLPPITGEGEHRFNLIARDFFGHETVSDTKIIYIDTVPPRIGELKAGHRGSDIKYIRTEYPEPGIKNAVLSVDITDPNIDRNSVYADLTGINQEQLYKDRYGHVKATCTAGETVTCSWPNVYINPGSSARISVQVNASDSYGNWAIKELSKNFIADNQYPEVQSLKPVDCSIAECYVNEGEANITVKINKRGVSFHRRQVYFDFSSMGKSRYQADYCKELSTSSWECGRVIEIPRNLNVGSFYSIYIGHPSVDDSGNFVRNMDDSGVRFDDINPVVENVTIYEQGTHNQFYRGGRKVDIIMNVTDEDSSVKSAVLYASQAVKNLDPVVTDCSDGVCEWHSIGPLLPGYRNVTLEFDVLDHAGNQIRYEYDNFEILSESDDTTMLWWYNNLELTPHHLDMAINQYVPGALNIWARFQLEELSSGLKTLSMNLDGCIEEDSANDVDARLFRAGKDRITGDHVYMILDIDKDFVFNVSQRDNLSFTCPLRIGTRDDNKVYPSQTINITFDLPVIDSGHNMVDNYKQKIESAKKEVEDSDWIESAQKFFYYSKTVCDFVYKAMGLYQAISAAMSFAATGIKQAAKTPGFHGLLGIGFGIDKSVLGMGALASTLEWLGKWYCSLVRCNMLDDFAKAEGGLGNAAGMINKMISTIWGGEFLNIVPKDGAEERLYDNWMGKGGFKSSCYEMSQESIFLSVLCFCIPGIITNLQKAREIDCSWIYCMENFVSMGYNPYMCDQMREEMYCNYVYGQIFNLIPFSQLFNKIGELIQLMTTDLTFLTFYGIGFVCAFFPDPDSSVWVYGCSALKAVDVMTSLYSGITTTLDAFGSESQSMCELALDG